MKWKSIKDDGLPEPSDEKTYFILHETGVGYGRYAHDIEWVNGRFEPVEECKWFLDFDSVGDEEGITHYMEIEYPEGYFDE